MNYLTLLSKTVVLLQVAQKTIILISFNVNSNSLIVYKIKTYLKSKLYWLTESLK